jgi:hypothetical protein
VVLVTDTPRLGEGEGAFFEVSAERQPLALHRRCGRGLPFRCQQTAFR